MDAATRVDALLKETGARQNALKGHGMPLRGSTEEIAHTHALSAVRA